MQQDLATIPALAVKWQVASHIRKVKGDDNLYSPFLDFNINASNPMIPLALISMNLNQSKTWPQVQVSGWRSYIEYCTFYTPLLSMVYQADVQQEAL